MPGLRSGRFGRLLLTTGSSSTVMVPAEAVVQQGQLETVFVVDGDVARLRLVRTGRQRDGWVEIVSGLSGGEDVAVPDSVALIDGQRVNKVRVVQ